VAAATEDTPLWLSHHRPDEYDRCIVIAGRHICRRCVVLYPLAFLAGAVLSAVSWPEGLDVWLLWLLPLPSVLELIGEQRGIIRHSPTRLVAFTVPLAVACAQLYLRYLDEPGDRLVWTEVGVYGGLCVLETLMKLYRRPSGGGAG
jgi:hypothetical protein